MESGQLSLVKVKFSANPLSGFSVNSIRRPGKPASSSLAAASTGLRPILLCLSHLRWDFVFQRPQHLLSRAVATHTVIFMEEPVMAPDGATAARLDTRSTEQGVTVVVPVLPAGLDLAQAEAAQRDLLDALLDELAAPLAVLWFYTPMALAFAAHLRPAVMVYDCMDELSLFSSAPPRLRELEQQLFDRADLVFTGGRSLYAAKQDRHSSVHLFPSSVDSAHFLPARAGGQGRSAEPADQAAIPRPRLGYFGVIDERLDQELVVGIATLRPEWQIIMLGPYAKLDPARLPRRDNLHWLGGKSYALLPSYLAGWDIGLMPFALNDATRFISPTKTPEFLAAGIPVVSTPVHDVVHDYGTPGLVEIASDAAGFVAAAERLMSRPRQPWLAAVDQRLAAGSWDRTWSAMLALLDDAQAVSPRCGSSTTTHLEAVSHV